MDEEQALKGLHEGRRCFDNNFMLREWWLGHKGCVDPRFSGNSVVVNLVGFPVHLVY